MTHLFNVTIATGELCYDESDFELPGYIPVELERSYRSELRRSGVLGYGWSWSWDIILRPTLEGFVLDLDSGAVETPFPKPAVGGAAPTAPVVISGPYLLLKRDDGSTMYFSAEEAVRRATPILAIEDAYENRLVFVNVGRRVHELVDTENRRLRFTYDASGRVVTIDLVAGGVRDAPSRIVTYAYDGQGDLVTVIDRCGAATTYEYADHLLVGATNRVGGAYYAAYDSQRRCVRRWRGDRRLNTVYAYDDRRHRVSVTNALGHIDVFSLDEKGLLLEEITPDGAVTRYAYDAGGGLVATTTGNAGTLLAIEMTNGTQQVTMVDEAGVPQTQRIDLVTGARYLRDGTGAEWASLHDDNGELLEARSPVGTRTTYEYDARGELSAFTQPSGNRIRFMLDESGRSGLVSDDFGELARMRWDVEGRMIEYGEPHTEPIRYRYDPLGRLVGLVQPNGAVFEFRIDGEGEVLEIVDPLGGITRQTVTPYGDVTAETSPAGLQIRWDYDALGRVVGIRNEADEAMVFEYDARDRIVTQRFFDGLTEHYRYDDVDNLIYVGVPEGDGTAIDVDPAGKPLRVVCADGSSLDVEYDAAGRVTAATTGEVTIRFEYDADGRLVREDQAGTILDREYDDAGNCSSLTVTGLGRRSFEHDLRGRLVRLVDFDGTAVHFEYDLLDRCVATRADGTTIRYEYAPYGRLVRASASANGVTRDVRYEHDPLGRIAARRLPDGRRREYEYDPDSRLQAHRDGTARVPHALSPTGDRLRTAFGDEVSYGRGGRLERVSTATTFAFDGRGRLAVRSDPARRLDLHYDGFDRLVRVTSDAGLDVRHVFDATGRRLFKVGPAGSTRFIWDGDTLLAEVPTTGDGTASYITEPDANAPYWVSTGGRRVALLTEPNGYPLLSLAPDGTQLSDDPDPYGLATLGAAEVRRQPLRFAGQYADAETGLYYNRHRFYDPETGRYLTPDPIGIEGGLNAYSYPSDPLNVIDPLGLTITVLQKMGPKTPQVRKKECPAQQKRKKRKKNPASQPCNTSRGGSIHNDCLKMMAKAAGNANMKTKTDCPQMFGGGKSNRPDLNMFAGTGAKSTYVEWDYAPGDRARNHIRDICRNHPGAIIYLVKIPKSLRYKTGRPNKQGKATKLKKPGTITRGQLTEQDCGIDVIKKDMGI